MFASSQLLTSRFDRSFERPTAPGRPPLLTEAARDFCSEGGGSAGLLLRFGFQLLDALLDSFQGVREALRLVLQGL